MLLLEDVSDPDGPIARVTATCPGTPLFNSYVNQAARKLLRRGDFPETVVPIFVCVKQGCIVWPRYTDAVRKLNICNRAVDVHNLWYKYMDLPTGCHGNWTTTDWPSSVQGWLGSPLPGLFDEGRTSVFQDVQGDGRLIRVYTRCQKDLGKTMQIFGTDNNGQPLQERDASDNWRDGLTLTLQLPFASTSVYVRHIDYVVREATQCPVNVFAYNASQNVLEDIAQYDGSETRPSYQRTKLQIPFPNTPWTGCGTTSPNCCATMRGVMALVKLRHIAAVNPTDLIIPPNEDAIEDMVQSIKFKEKGDLSNAMAYEASAVREANRELENQSPDSIFSANDLTCGPGGFGQQQF